MNTLHNRLVSIINEIPPHSLRELLNYALFLKEKSKRISDNKYLESVPVIVDSILDASKEDLKDCKKNLLLHNNTDNNGISQKKYSAKELLSLPHSERSKILKKQAASAKTFYEKNPDSLLPDLIDDILEFNNFLN
jgi:hypothetical protein